MHPKDLSIKDFTYELPPERIAKYPLPVRDTSKLLIWKKGQYNRRYLRKPRGSFTRKQPAYFQ
jgi:hypothetical protein